MGSVLTVKAAALSSSNSEPLYTGVCIYLLPFVMLTYRVQSFQRFRHDFLRILVDVLLFTDPDPVFLKSPGSSASATLLNTEIMQIKLDQLMRQIFTISLYRNDSMFFRLLEKE